MRGAANDNSRYFSATYGNDDANPLLSARKKRVGNAINQFIPSTNGERKGDGDKARICGTLGVKHLTNWFLYYIVSAGNTWIKTLMASLNETLGRLAGPLTALVPFEWDKGYLSLDIGSSSIKMVEVRGQGAGLKVTNAGMIPLRSGAVHNHCVQDIDQVSQAIRTLVEEHGVRTREVVAAVPGPAVIIKPASFPAQDPTALEETILFEAGNFIPESLDNVNLDYQVLGRDPATGNTDVLLVAVRKDIINSYLAAMSEAGLTPTIMDVDYFAVENMFEANYSPDPGEVVALINIGAGYASLTILKGGRSSFTGDISVGGEQFTNLLAQEFGIGREQAEAAKISGLLEGYDKKDIDRVLSVTSEQLLDEIQRSLSFFWTASAEEPIGAVYLSGGTAQLPGLASAIGARLQVPVEIVNPFRSVNIGRQVDTEFLSHHAPSLAVSVGLATRRPGDK